MFPNKDTKLYGSFSQTPGNNGCKFFNEKFKENNINAIYKSFYSNNIEDSFIAAKILGFSGFAVSMPFKQQIIKLVNVPNESDNKINAINTVVRKNDKWYGYNLDKIGVLKYIKLFNLEFINIVGQGGFGRSVKAACELANIDYNIITRDNWEELNNIKRGIVFNCTPIDINSNKDIIDGRPFTKEGKQIARLIAEEQLKLYLNEQY